MNLFDELQRLIELAFIMFVNCYLLSPHGTTGGELAWLICPFSEQEPITPIDIAVAPISFENVSVSALQVQT